MMQKAGINVVRIAESTWSTLEPQPGVFCFEHVDRVLDAMNRAEIHVIVGTPTYAIPAWMERMHPEVLAETKEGRRRYGPRQIMDITSPAYLFYAERMIRTLIKHVCGHAAVIGYQLDNETKHYGTSGKNVQCRFVKYLRKKFGTTNAVNKAFGLDYWSNRVDEWEDFPDVRGTINASLGAEFSKFQRLLVTEFLQWQAGIVNEYRKPGQFITHNFDFEWTGYFHGVQPDVDQFQAAEALTVAGCDIYHPTQNQLTGAEISVCGDLTRSLKQKPYLVLETQAQGFPQWTPYPGQLRLQAFSHLAAGAEMVEYWHWHSLHNGCETYWKGLLGHDFQENDTYCEAVTIGRDFKKLSPFLTGLHKENRVAVLVSNEALTALEWFPVSPDLTYNGVMRWLYDALFRMNVETDFIFPSSDKIDQYALIVVPALYAAPESLLLRLKNYVKNGGHLMATFKTGFSDQNVKVYPDIQPHLLNDCFGVSYTQYTVPESVLLDGFKLPHEQRQVKDWMELLVPQNGAEVLSRYEHPVWSKYAAVVRNHFGKGTATYVGCYSSDAVIEAILDAVLKEAGLSLLNRPHWPVIVKHSLNSEGKAVWFFLNYSGNPQEAAYGGMTGINLFSGESVGPGETMKLAPWDAQIIAEK